MYAQVLINHAYSRKQAAFTYEIPKELNLEEGSGVLVPFQKGEKAGIVLGISAQKPNFETREIQALIQSEVLLRPWQIELATWISEHYFCSNYDAIKLMLPKHIWRAPKNHTVKEKAASRKTPKIHPLTPEQESIVKKILEEKPRISLLKGITGSGKTEIYKHLIQTKIQEGKQALLLVPEIALTPQLLKEFEGLFPKTAVIHSRVSEGKRAQLWRDIYSGKSKLVIGSRSALFSPFKDLGIIVIDEEHEWTYKQEQSPRYHARNAAIKIAELTGAQVLLGSATPSIESMYKAQQGHYSYFSLDKRIHNTELPKVEIVDMREELKARNFSIFSDKLEQKIRSTLAAKEQVLLFLNRRGSASATVCRDCGYAMECPYCDVKLTYHERTFKHQTLVCHHCGRLTAAPNTCLQCESPRIKHLGTGTERVEQEIQKLFPTARIARADKDTMGKVDSFKKLHTALKKHEIDILIGTQMIAKGWDIPNMSLVGVILADMGLHIPDFRATERSFQLLTQVAGRAGRRKKQGEVVIQTYNPENPAIQKAATHDYTGFYEQEISSREGQHVPPFAKIIKLIHVNLNKKNAQIEAQQLHKKLEGANNEHGTEHQIYMAPALIPRINNKYHWHILIQGPNPRQVLESLQSENLENWRIDVDPVHTV